MTLLGLTALSVEMIRPTARLARSGARNNFSPVDVVDHAGCDVPLDDRQVLERGRVIDGIDGMVRQDAAHRLRIENRSEDGCELRRRCARIPCRDQLTDFLLDLVSALSLASSRMMCRGDRFMI